MTPEKEDRRTPYFGNFQTAFETWSGLQRIPKGTKVKIYTVAGECTDEQGGLIKLNAVPFSILEVADGAV